MATKKKVKLGRPFGSKTPGGYVPKVLRKNVISIRLPFWMLEKLAKRENLSRYVEELILEDTGWKAPKV